MFVWIQEKESWWKVDTHLLTVTHCGDAGRYKRFHTIEGLLEYLCDSTTKTLRKVAYTEIENLLCYNISLAYRYCGHELFPVAGDTWAAWPTGMNPPEFLGEIPRKNWLEVGKGGGLTIYKEIK